MRSRNTFQTCRRMSYGGHEPEPEVEMIPVGGIHLSVSDEDPATGFGYGVWQRLAAGRFLIGADDATFIGGDEGGSDTVTPAGTVSQPTFTGSSAQATSAVSAGTPAGTNSAPTFTGTSAQSTSAVSAGTPAGTNSAPTFTGNALAGHAHELPIQLSSTTATRQIAAATFGQGTSRAATGASAAGSSNTTSAAVALSQSVSAGTPSGTVSAPTFTGSALGTHQHTLTPAGTVSAPTFTGSALGTHSHTLTPAGTVSQPTFTGQAHSTLPPFLAVFMWVRIS